MKHRRSLGQTQPNFKIVTACRSLDQLPIVLHCDAYPYLSGTMRRTLTPFFSKLVALLKSAKVWRNACTSRSGTMRMRRTLAFALLYVAKAIITTNKTKQNKKKKKRHFLFCAIFILCFSSVWLVGFVLANWATYASGYQSFSPTDIQIH